MIHILDGEIGKAVHDLHFKIGKIFDNLPLAALSGEGHDFLHFQIRKGVHHFDFEISKFIHELDFAVKSFAF